MNGKNSTQNVDFGKVVAKIVISPKSEIHIKNGAIIKGEDYVDIRKYVKTNSYSGYTKSGLMVPKRLWKEFVKAVRAVK